MQCLLDLYIVTDVPAGRELFLACVPEAHNERQRPHPATIPPMREPGEDFKHPCPPLIKMDAAVKAKVGKLSNL
jgi:hypothetical protein